ncbi:MAG TPA: hypothetical protein VJ694_01200, partial [Patescibacteria group bacterium]|nr:hypothetical protein [Patescibacteria group bacterium]
MTTNDPFGGATIPRTVVGVDTLTINGLHCRINLPKARVSRYDGSGQEIDQGLPEYAQRKAFKVDDCERAPADWMRSDPARKAASYFTAVKPEHGLWLDFNQNNGHAHDVAAIVSIQGVNAVTGQPVNSLALEQYNEVCPVHQVRFGAERLCQACGYKWPAQNYLASTGAGHQFWLDGFRAKDGAVRQFVFTEDQSRGVAAAIIGKARSQAIGVAFYLSKALKPQPVYRSRGGGLESFGGEEGLESLGAAPRSIEVAAGARINQQVHPDKYRLDYWQSE